MVKLVQKLGVGYDWLLARPVRLKLVTGFLGLLILYAVIVLVTSFPTFFAALTLIGIVLFAAYIVGSVVWGIIGS